MGETTRDKEEILKEIKLFYKDLYSLRAEYWWSQANESR